ncbi:MAG: hypothetical protein EU531_03920 [Promethearchaeota archaeon]|nr:MAG: hypothetical protein EU531_03920 [Candidatus Lokiarchaeota archaeon]
MNSFYKRLKERLSTFFEDDFGGNLIEYALLIGFALFIFFIIVGIITSILDWTLGLSNDFFNLFG